MICIIEIYIPHQSFSGLQVEVLTLAIQAQVHFQGWLSPGDMQKKAFWGQGGLRGLGTHRKGMGFTVSKQQEVTISSWSGEFSDETQTSLLSGEKRSRHGGAHL